MTPIRLIIWTIIIVVLVGLINIGGGLYWSNGQTLLMIVSAIILMVWLVFFGIKIFHFYLWPKALYAEVFQGLGFTQKLMPTKEIYQGRFENIPVTCEVIKGRDRTNAYIYLNHPNTIYLAAGRQDPLQKSGGMMRLNNLPPKLENYFIFTDQVGPGLIFIQKKEITDSLADFLENIRGEIYWEKNRIKVRLNVHHPIQLLQAMKNAAALTQK